MIKGTNFIGETPSAQGHTHFQAFNPADGSCFPEQFAVATTTEVDAAVQKAREAFYPYRSIEASRRADFLEAIAGEIMALKDALVIRASGESGLPEGRIQGERGRTCNQLKAFAHLIREGSWVEATIDTAVPDRSPVPRPDLRKLLTPLGPVVVFGASNFPLAFSTAGGDTASALAAGNPVIVKGHESHPGTNELVSQAILRAARKTEMPDGVFSMVNGSIPVGRQLAGHSGVKAIGFTGSLKGGRALFDLANQREEPIPVYAEMGSINPIFILPDKLAQETEALAERIAGSVTLGAGQFCTNPGLLVGIGSDALDRFSEALADRLSATPPAPMLNAKIAADYYDHRESLIRQEGVEPLGNPDPPGAGSRKGKALMARVAGSYFLRNPRLQEEIFGPFTLLVTCENEKEMIAVAKGIHGQLTGTLAATADDLARCDALVRALTDKVGRIVFNGVPTGVEVCPSMHHGGPYPATTGAGFTSVGTAAISRFVRPVAYQNWPDEQLPAALQNENPLKLWRLVNGERTKDPIL